MRGTFGVLSLEHEGRAEALYSSCGVTRHSGLNVKVVFATAPEFAPKSIGLSVKSSAFRLFCRDRAEQTFEIISTA
jgi:hypothetical protein